MTTGDLSRLEPLIGRILRLGVTASALLLGIGLALWLSGSSAAPRWLNAGLIVLMAVPVSRILASFVSAILLRDRLLVWATGIVLVILGFTIAYSLRVAG